MVPEIWSETVGHFFPFYLPPNDLEYQNFEKNEKNTWRYYPFIHTCVP